MPKKFLYFSLFFHVFGLVIISLNFHNMFSTKIKDNGHVVFDFVKIGTKSQAPILSSNNNHASVQKSFSDSKPNQTPKQQVSNIKPTNNKPTSNISNNKPTNNAITNKQNSSANINKQASNASTNKSTNNASINKPISNTITNKPVSNKPKNNKTQDKNKAHVNNKQESKNKPKIIPTKPKDKQEKANKNKSNTNKALVNLQEINSQKKAINGNKAKINSFIDNVLADGEHENDGINAEEIGETLTATQIDLIRQTIRKCWHFPAGLKDADTLVVDIQMELDPNGYVKKAKIVDQKRMQSDSAFRTAAENAYRAVLDPECNPLPLPKEKYEEWKDLELSFNPKDLLN